MPTRKKKKNIFPLHCTHLQIAQANPQSEICKRVQLPTHFESLYNIGIHGIEHAYRVLLLVREIAAQEKLSSKLMKQLEFCAIFHDIGRINDEIDDLHGKRAIQLLIKNSFWGLEKYDNQLVRFIIENHCIYDSLSRMTVGNYNLHNTEESIYLLSIFKDADNLDRFRIGDFDSKYLRNKSSYSLITTASQLFFTGVNQIIIIEHLEKTFWNLKKY
ncbi:MAG: HD domain-containing protein [Saprospiraceae bacterium]|nr:HD domain-containing protein [Saprospiraceae bacterium]